MQEVLPFWQATQGGIWAAALPWGDRHLTPNP